MIKSNLHFAKIYIANIKVIKKNKNGGVLYVRKDSKQGKSVYVCQSWIAFHHHPLIRETVLLHGINMYAVCKLYYTYDRYITPSTIQPLIL